MLKLKKKSIILIIITLIVLLMIGVFSFFIYNLKPVSKESSEVTFIVDSGTSKKAIINSLENANLIRNKYVVMAYLFLNSDLKIQAGTYNLNRNMNVKEILNILNDGKIKIDTVTITFIEGKNISDFKTLIANNFPYTEEEVEEVLTNKEYMTTLVEKYDFLTEEVLNDNIYYALEGYLFPDTYEFLATATIEEIIEKILDNTQVKLAGLELGNTYTIHELLTMASIVELEAVSETDRQSVAQVIYKRLEMGKGLGMDVTTYYAVKKSLKEELTLNDLKTINPYNTSESNPSMAGKLPIGPICNPSLMSILSTLNPSDTDYIYFYANIKTHEVFFASTYEEFLEIQKEVG